jgi:hypothetical protein
MSDDDAGWRKRGDDPKSSSVIEFMARMHHILVARGSKEMSINCSIFLRCGILTLRDDKEAQAARAYDAAILPLGVRLFNGLQRPSPSLSAPTSPG